MSDKDYPAFWPHATKYFGSIKKWFSYSIIKQIFNHLPPPTKTIYYYKIDTKKNVLNGLDPIRAAKPIEFVCINKFETVQYKQNYDDAFIVLCVRNNYELLKL